VKIVLTNWMMKMMVFFIALICHYDICGHVANSETQLKSDNPQRFSKDCESGYRLVLTKVLHGYTHFVANTTYKEDKYVRDKCNTLFDVQCIMILIYLTFVPIVLQNIKTRKLWSCIVWQDIPWSRLKIWVNKQHILVSNSITTRVIYSEEKILLSRWSVFLWRMVYFCDECNSGFAYNVIKIACLKKQIWKSFSILNYSVLKVTCWLKWWISRALHKDECDPYYSVNHYDCDMCYKLD